MRARTFDGGRRRGAIVDAHSTASALACLLAIRSSPAAAHAPLVWRVCWSGTPDGPASVDGPLPARGCSCGKWIVSIDQMISSQRERASWGVLVCVWASGGERRKRMRQQRSSKYPGRHPNNCQQRLFKTDPKIITKLPLPAQDPIRSLPLYNVTTPRVSPRPLRVSSEGVPAVLFSRVAPCGGL